MSHKEFTDSFLSELYDRTITFSEKSSTGGVWIQIDLDGSSTSFIGKLEEFLRINKSTLKLHIRGMEYLVELLGFDSPLEAYKKSNWP